MSFLAVKQTLWHADRLIRRDRRQTAQTPIAQWLILVVVCSASYGLVMGSFGGVMGERAWQLAFSAIKVPLLLLVTFVICLPSFFVLNTLLGLRSDFPEVLRALTATQAGLTIVLASLAPYTMLWYASFANYQQAVAFNTVMFGIASVTAQLVLKRLYEPLVRRRGEHRQMMWLWIVLFAFVGIQLAWVLRPFVGDPHSEVQFFRKDAWDNAYIIVFRMFWDIVTE